MAAAAPELVEAGVAGALLLRCVFDSSHMRGIDAPGFGLLMYGFGSKKQLLEDFASTTLTDFTVIVINCYLPSINLKQV